MDTQYYQMLLISDVDHYLCARPDEDLYTLNWDDDKHFNKEPLDVSNYEQGTNLSVAIGDFLKHCSEELIKKPYKHKDVASNDVVFVGVREAYQPDWAVYRYEKLNPGQKATLMDGAILKFNPYNNSEQEPTDEELETIANEEDSDVESL